MMGDDFVDGHVHITPVLANMHWLLVQYWIEYTTALITFKVLPIQQPQYLSECIHHQEAPRLLRSCGINILHCVSKKGPNFETV